MKKYFRWGKVHGIHSDVRDPSFGGGRERAVAEEVGRDLPSFSQNGKEAFLSFEFFAWGASMPVVFGKRGRAVGLTPDRGGASPQARRPASQALGLLSSRALSSCRHCPS